MKLSVTQYRLAILLLNGLLTTAVAGHTVYRRLHSSYSPEDKVLEALLKTDAETHKPRGREAEHPGRSIHSVTDFEAAMRKLVPPLEVKPVDGDKAKVEVVETTGDEPEVGGPLDEDWEFSHSIAYADPQDERGMVFLKRKDKSAPGAPGAIKPIISSSPGSAGSRLRNRPTVAPRFGAAAARARQARPGGGVPGSDQPKKLDAFECWDVQEDGALTVCVEHIAPDRIHYVVEGKWEKPYALIKAPVPFYRINGKGPGHDELRPQKPDPLESELAAADDATKPFVLGRLPSRLEDLLARKAGKPTQRPKPTVAAAAGPGAAARPGPQPPGTITAGSSAARAAAVSPEEQKKQLEELGNTIKDINKKDPKAAAELQKAMQQMQGGSSPAPKK